MEMRQTDSAAQAAKVITVRSRETGKVYRVLRAYKYTLYVTPAWLQHGYKMTLPKSAFDLTHTCNNPE